MIILFVLVGVLLLGGGAATIIDGLPYMVLERGFTQVIVGTVVATGGLIVLALSRVLAELMGVRKTLSNAMMALSVASLSSEASKSASLPQLAGAGLAAGVGAALVAAHTADAGRSDKMAETADPASDKADEPDLFAQYLAEDHERDRVSSDTPAVPEDEQPEPVAGLDLDEARWPGEPTDEPEPSDESAAVEPAQASDETAATDDPIVSDEIPPETDEPEHDTFAQAPLDVEESGRRVEPWLDPPKAELPSDAADRSASGDPEDEFDFLRARLSDRSIEAGSQVEPEARHDDRPGQTLEEAESWMSAPGARREPWFDPPGKPAPHADAASSLADETDEASPALQPPAWPPQTRDMSALQPTLGETGELQRAEDEAVGPEPEPDYVEPSVRQPDEVSEPVEPTPAPAAAAAPPASSEEGIVGAYQVGDAHFTIFADGSIKARTPDGDYSFASMDELKTYLASEKSRLGV